MQETPPQDFHEYLKWSAQKINDNDERKAVGLYAVLARDPTDFMDMIAEPGTHDDALKILLSMLRHPNPKHDKDTRELNAIGAGAVEQQLKTRGVL